MSRKFYIKQTDYGHTITFQCWQYDPVSKTESIIDVTTYNTADIIIEKPDGTIKELTNVSKLANGWVQGTAVEADKIFDQGNGRYKFEVRLNSTTQRFTSSVHEEYVDVPLKILT